MTQASDNRWRLASSEAARISASASCLAYRVSEARSGHNRLVTHTVVYTAACDLSSRCYIMQRLLWRRGSEREDGHEGHEADHTGARGGLREAEPYQDAGTEVAGREGRAPARRAHEGAGARPVPRAGAPPLGGSRGGAERWTNRVG